MTKLETIVTLHRMRKLGIIDGAHLSERFMKFIPEHMKRVSLESMMATAAEYGIHDTERTIEASLIVAFCNYAFPEEYQLEPLADMLKKIRDDTLSLDDLERKQAGLPTPDEFRTFDEAAKQLKDQTK